MTKRKHHTLLQNKPGEPIVNRDLGAKFYCIACYKTYQKCKCRVYMSADTLPPHGSKNREKRESHAFPCDCGGTACRSMNPKTGRVRIADD